MKLLYCLMLLGIVQAYNWTPHALAQQEAVEIDLDVLIEAESSDSLFLSAYDDDDDYILDLGENLVTDTRSLAARLGDYSALTIIDNERFGPTTELARILERVAGLDVRRLGGSGQLSTVMIRGASSGQVLVLLDGQAMSPQQATDLSMLSATGLDRIEVLRGPQALQFGPGAMGGVVNLVTVRPTAQPAGPRYPDSGLSFKEYFSELTRHEFSEGQESGNTYRYSALAGSHGLHGLSMGATNPDSSWTLKAMSAENDYSFERAGGLTASRRNADVSRYEFQGSWSTDEAGYRLALSDMSRGIPGSAEFPSLPARLDRQAVWLQRSAGHGRSAVSAQFSHVRDPDPFLNQGVIDNRDMLLHVEHEHRSDDSLLRPRLDFADGDTVHNQARLGTDYSQWHEQESGNWSTLFSWGVTASTDMGLLPMAAVSTGREVSSDGSTYFSLARAVREPSFEELYMSDSGSLRGNPDLDPEIVDTAEIGYRHSFSSARLECSIFYSRYRDSIIFAPVSAYLVEARNTGQADVAGAEGTLDLRIARDLWWTSSATWLPLAEYADGITLTGRSRLHASSGLQYSGEGWNTGINLDHSSSIPADLFGNLRTRPRSIVDFELTVGETQDGISLAVNNVFNQQARDAWNYPLPGREFIISWSSFL